MIKLHACLLLCALVLVPDGAETTSVTARGFDLSRPVIVSFVDEVTARDALSPKAVLKLLARALPQPDIIERVTKPAERVLEWWDYRALFVNEKRISEGAQFWLDHRQS